MKKSVDGRLTLRSKKIASYACAFRSDLTEVTLSPRVTTLGAAAFLTCRRLGAVAFAEGLRAIGENAFCNCSDLTEALLPQSVETLGPTVFKDCGRLSKVVLPEGLRELPAGTFENCISLTEITLPASLERIGDDCFSGCERLTAVHFGNRLQAIGERAFARCESLSALTLPASLQSLGAKAFRGCRALTNVTFSAPLAFLGKSVFPHRVCEELPLCGKAFCSSLTAESEYDACPAVRVPAGVRELALGFDTSLPYYLTKRGETCPDFLLLPPDGGRPLFVGRRYYGHGDAIVRDGDLLLDRYDDQFPKAEDDERAIAAAYRLVDGRPCGEAAKARYEAALQNADEVRRAAVFAVEMNDEAVLALLLDRGAAAIAPELYALAARKGRRRLLETLSLAKPADTLDDLHALIENL